MFLALAPTPAGQGLSDTGIVFQHNKHSNAEKTEAND